MLVHCIAGMNRSGVLAIAFVAQSMRWPLLRALKHCLERRGCLLWNESFQRQLVLFAQRKDSLSSTATTAEEEVQLEFQEEEEEEKARKRHGSERGASGGRVSSFPGFARYLRGRGRRYGNSTQW